MNIAIIWLIGKKTVDRKYPINVYKLDTKHPEKNELSWIHSLTSLSSIPPRTLP